MDEQNHDRSTLRGLYRVLGISAFNLALWVIMLATGKVSGLLAWTAVLACAYVVSSAAFEIIKLRRNRGQSKAGHTF